MSLFFISQALVIIAITFDLMSFQFRERKRIVACLFCATVLIAGHFVLLEHWTAASLMLIASIRYLTSVFSTSSKLKYFFCTASLIATLFTFSGLLSLLSCLASLLQTVAAFNKDDKRLRVMMVVGTSVWLLHNYLVGSPTAVIMSILFMSSNLIGFYRYYYKKDVVA